MTGSFGHTTSRTLTTFLSLLTGNIWICAHESAGWLVKYLGAWGFSWYEKSKDDVSWRQAVMIINHVYSCMHPVRFVGRWFLPKWKYTSMVLTNNPPGLELDSCWRWISEICLFSGSRFGGLDKELLVCSAPYGGDFGRISWKKWNYTPVVWQELSENFARD